MYRSSCELISKFQSFTYHIGSHSVTCHATQVNAPYRNPSCIRRYSIYLPRRDERPSWLWWLITNGDGLPVCRQLPAFAVTKTAAQSNFVDRGNHYAEISHNCM